MTGEPALSRRALLRRACAGVLAAVVLPAVSGCTSTAHRSTRRTGDTSPVVTADVTLLARSLTDEERLLAYCTATAARHPALAADLAPVRRVQHTHVAVMRRALPRPYGQRTAAHVRVPRRSAAARAELLSLLKRAERRRLVDCLRAQSGPLARMFASASASHAATRELLIGHR